MRNRTDRLLSLIALALAPGLAIAADPYWPAVTNIPVAQALSAVQLQTTNGVTTYAEFQKLFYPAGKPTRCNGTKTNGSYMAVFSVSSQTMDGGIVAEFIHSPKDDRSRAVLWCIRSWTNQPDGDVRVEVTK